MNNQDTGAICLNMLRDLDRDRYLACLFSPEDKRPALAALYAFNAEIARIRDAVREPLPGEVRMQWWRDLLEGNSHGDINANPIAAGLMQCIETYHLPRQSLVNLLEARVFDLYDDPFENRNALEGYAGETASAIIQLASLVLDANAATLSAHAAGHAGVAQAMAGIMLLLPLHRRRGQVYIPVDILSAAGLDRETFLAGEDRQRITAAIDIFCAIALDHLAEARQTKIDAACFPAFLPVAITESVLKKAKRMGASIFDADIQPSLLRRQWLMTKSVFLKRF